MTFDRFAEFHDFYGKVYRQINKFIFFHGDHLCEDYNILNEILLRNMK